jgi:hypothetical protein
MTETTTILTIKENADLGDVTSAIMDMVRQAESQDRPIDEVVAEHLDD